MFILDSLSLNRTTTKSIKQKATTFPPTITTTSFSTSVFKSQENQTVRNLIPLITATTTYNETCEKTTNKCKLVQQQQQQNPQHLQPQHENKVVEKFLLQKMPSPSSHKIKEIIKNNNNEKLNDEPAMTAIENNTTITNNNTMPQEKPEKEEEEQKTEQQQNNNININGNENICAAEWGRVPAINNSHHNGNNCNVVGKTTNRNASATTTTIATTTTATTTTSTSHTFKALNNDNTEQNKAHRVQAKMLTNCIQNNVDLNTIALAPQSAAAAAETLKHECNSCSCLPFSICLNKAASKSMHIPFSSYPSLQNTKQICSLNNDGDGFHATHDNNDDDNVNNVYDGGCLCHNNSNNNYNNCYSNNNTNTSNVILNTNSFLMLECSPLTCENERKQQTRNLIQNGNKNIGNAAIANAAASSATTNAIVENSSTTNKATKAEYLPIWGEQKYCIAQCDGESVKDPIGNSFEYNLASSVVSPVDSVLENFEKFLNSVKLENRNLNPTVAECHDLIDLSDEPANFPLQSKVNKLTNECYKLQYQENIINSDADMPDHCNLENLLYCDLNETLEEQHLLESKQILELKSAATTPTPPPAQMETEKIMKTLTEVNETRRIGDNVNDDNKFNATNILMVDEVNETTAKTPVTCINFKTNTTNKSNNREVIKNIKDTCALIQSKESCQNPNSCKVTTVTAVSGIETQEPLDEEIKTNNQICSTKSIENISPLTAKTEANEISLNLQLKANTNNCRLLAATQQQSIALSFAEYNDNCHHYSPLDERQQQENQILAQPDQFTSAYTLRDFAKCLKPSPDEDIKYTLNFLQNENKKNENKTEKLQNSYYNLNKNKQIVSTTNNDKVFHDKKSPLDDDNIVLSEESFQENILYNKNFPLENNLLDVKEETKEKFLQENILNSQEIAGNCELSDGNILLKTEIEELKDTQFLEIENLSTPKFCFTKGPNAQTSDTSHQLLKNVVCPPSREQQDTKENFKDLENCNNELNFDGNEEKIYTRENNFEPLLYLTFVWPTKNEGQVVTTRRQGNDDQGENEIEKAAKAENEEFAKRAKVLGKTYGTCNRNHVEGSHKGYLLKSNESIVTNNEDNGDLLEQRILIDKQNGEHKKQGPFAINSRQNFSIVKPQTKNENELEKTALVSDNCNSVNFESLKENFSNFPNKTKQSEPNKQNEKCKENCRLYCKEKIDVKAKKLDFDETKSNCLQQNIENTLNLNLKRLNDIKEHSLKTKQQKQNQQHFLRNKEEEDEAQENDYTSLEEFEASQRLKRLLQQHQQIRTRYDTLPTTKQFNNYKQTKTTTTTATTESFESLKTEIARHSKDDLCLTNNTTQGVFNEATTTDTETKANSCFITKANKLQTDCEITFERSSVLHANAHKLPLIETKETCQLTKDSAAGIKEPNELNNEKEHGQIESIEKKLDIEKSLKKTHEIKDINSEKLKDKQNKEYSTNSTQQYVRNSPQAYVSKKEVRLTQPQTQQTTLLLSRDIADEQKQQQQQQQLIETTENSENLRFPLAENINKKTDTIVDLKPIILTNKICYQNLQHIEKTKQLIQQQQKEQEHEEEGKGEEILKPAQVEVETNSVNEEQIADEYKSAFVATKPEIYKTFQPLKASNEKLSNIKTSFLNLNTLTATNSLSEFDTQRFSDFFHINKHLTTSQNINSSTNNNCYYYNLYNNNNNNNNHNYFIAHVLPEQYPLYTTNFIQPLQLPYCYDELFPNETRQQFKQNVSLNDNFEPTKTTTTAATASAVDVNDLQDDINSTSSNSSSPCTCDNCQPEIDQNRDCFLTITPNVIPLQQLNETEAIKYHTTPQPAAAATATTTNNKMREVNGQLRGLLKKPNRPPPARKNRVVFDETRNEFFEADYIILIREDCAYDEEDEEPCTCGEHELVRLCCEEGCQCNYSTTASTDDNRTPQSPKYAPPIEFVDEAALSPPDGYKDNGLKNTLGGALSGHIFGAQHLQQLQVIQRLQQQRAAMLAARNNTQIPPPPPPATSNPSSGQASVNQQSSSTASSTCSSSSPLNSSSTPSSATAAAAAAAAVATTVVSNNSMNTSATQHSPDDDTQGVCTECAECAECAAKQLQQDAECNSPQCQEDLTAPLGVPAVALLPIHTSSPERRMTQKEIIAGEERPRYVLQAQYKSSPVSERRIIREATEDLAANIAGSASNAAAAAAATSSTIATTVTASATSTLTASGGESDLLPPALPAKPGATSLSNDMPDAEKPPPIPPKENSPTTQISGILKGGKLWKQDSISQHSDDQNNTTSEDEAGSTSNGTIKRSVRFVTEDINNDEVDGQLTNADDEDNQINELIPIKKHSTLFKNALRPNSAVQQLFPSTVAHQTLTSEALRAFDESKRAGCLVSTLPGSTGDSDTLRRSMERNILRRSLIKKKAVKSDISLEERIKQLTCGIDEDNDELTQDMGEDDNSKNEDSTDLSHRDSPAGEENPQKFNINGNNSDKSFSPNSSVSSSSSSSSAYKKITEIFNREKKNQEKIMEMEESPIVIIPQECRCPAAPDLGMGIQVPVVHTQIHRTPPRQAEPKRQFLSTLAPLTACVAGNKDDLSSYYTLAAAHHNQAAQNAHAAEYNLAAIMTGEQNTTGISQTTGDEVRKVAPDVIAGTPGQEQQDELAAFAQQEANRTDKIKKRYSNEPINTKETNKETNSDDDEGNDYGFNKRPSVRGIKPKFSSTNEILQQMQDQLSQQMPSVAHSQPLPQPMKSYTLPKQSSASAMTKQLQQQQQQQQPSPQNMPHSSVATSQQQLPQQQQICSAVAAAAAMQIPANAAIAQQQTEQRTWSFYSETGGAGEQQHLPVESAAAAMQQTYYQTLPAGAMFRHTMIHQHQQHGPEEAMLYAQNCQAMATTIEPQPHYGHYARSPTRRPESPPPLRNYHQTMVLIPYNAETYSQFATTNMDPKVAHIQRQNILEYQQVGEMTQVTQQTIRVPIGYALPGMQLHVVAGRGHAAQYATAAAAQTHHHQHQRIMTQRYQFAQEASMAGFSERGVPEGAAAVSHSDCNNSGMISPTTGQQIAMQQQHQQQLQQQGAQLAQQQQQQQQQQQHQQQHQQQQQVNCQQQQQVQPQIQNNMQTAAAQGSVYYAMNV